MTEHGRTQLHLYCISIYSRDALLACEVAADVLHHPNNVLQLTEVPLFFLLALSPVRELCAGERELRTWDFCWKYNRINS